MRIIRPPEINLLLFPVVTCHMYLNTAWITVSSVQGNNVREFSHCLIPLAATDKFLLCFVMKSFLDRLVSKLVTKSELAGLVPLPGFFFAYMS